MNINISIDNLSSVPIYEQVKQQLRSQFVENKVKEGKPLPDIKKIALIAGVSIGTIDRALNELIAEGVCYRRPKKGTFVGNINNLTRKKTICGIYPASGLHSFEQDIVQASIYRGISGSAGKKDVDVFFLPAEPSSSISFYLGWSRFDFRGIIMLGWENFGVGMKLAQEFPQIKFVYLNYYFQNFELTPLNVYGIFNDDYSGAYQAVEYLLEKGHKKIAAGSVVLLDENYRQRIAGYVDALHDNGIKCKKEFINTMERLPGENLKEVGEKLAEEIIVSGQNPTALFCVNDLLAAGVLDYLKKKGMDGSIEVFGYDNLIPHISKDYGFSTVKIDFEKMGERAVEFLTDTKDRTFPKVLKITPQLLIRKYQHTKQGSV